MRYEECEKRKQAFLRDVRKALHKHLGTTNFNRADPLLLVMLQDGMSLYQPWMWPEKKK